jgi:tetratricopeptide (TPR) repeat protein
MRRFLAFAAAFALLPASVGAQSAQAPAAQRESAAYYFLAAQYYEENDKLDEAIDALNKAIALAPKSAELRAALASVYARQNRVVEALDTAEQALKFDAANREANRLIGSIYSALAEQNRPLRPGDDPAQYATRAIAALERTKTPGIPDLGVELALGRLYLRTRQRPKAIAAFERVFTQQPEYSDGGLLLASAQDESGKTEEAIATLKTTLEHTPSFMRGHAKLIEIYERERRWKEAAAAYAAAQAANPKADLAEGRATALLNSGGAKEARTLLEGAIATKKTPEPALLYLLAESQRQLKDYVAASATIGRMREQFPDDPRALLMDAQLQLAQGRKDEALNALAALVKRVPDQPIFAYQYAQLLQDAGRHADAEQVLRGVLARDPMDANALNSLGYMFAERGERLDEAVELLRRALKIEPGNASFLDSLGWAFFKQGKLADAEAPLAEAAAKMPANSVIQDHLGDLRFQQKRYAEAIGAWERALGGDGESIDRAVIERKLRDARSRVPKN